MMSELVTCYVCNEPGEEEFQTEIDGRVHVYIVHKNPGKRGSPKKCDGGYKVSEQEFMKTLESGEDEKEGRKYTKRYTRIAPDCTTRVLVEMYLHTCQRCGHSWTTKIKTPAACAKKSCCSKNWNMLK